MTYNKIKEAAQSLMAAEDNGRWKLADALALEVSGLAQQRKIDRLHEIATALSDDGIVTTSGNDYTAMSLAELESTARNWAARDRQPLAAFRTHQQAGNEAWRRNVLVALCDAARTKRWGKPRGLKVQLPNESQFIDIQDESWELAVKSIQRKIRNGHRYAVSANDLRIALGVKTNNPRVEVTDYVTVLGQATLVISTLEAMLKELGKGPALGVEVDDNLRGAIANAINRIPAYPEILLNTLNSDKSLTAEVSEFLAELGGN